jgi:hypothetical protein
MFLAPRYTLVVRAPSVDEYLRVRTGSDLLRRSRNEASLAISGSWSFRHVLGQGNPVGMGRIIEDGGWYFVTADTDTLPEHQHRGIGGTILDDLL